MEAALAQEVSFSPGQTHLSLVLLEAKPLLRPSPVQIAQPQRSLGEQGGESPSSALRNQQEPLAKLELLGGTTFGCTRLGDLAASSLLC